MPVMCIGLRQFFAWDRVEQPEPTKSIVY